MAVVDLAVPEVDQVLPEWAPQLLQALLLLGSPESLSGVGESVGLGMAVGGWHFKYEKLYLSCRSSVGFTLIAIW